MSAQRPVRAPIPTRNPAENFFRPPRKAPWSFYAIACAVGFTIGASLEFGMIKSGYYDIMRYSEARKTATERMELESALKQLEELEREGKARNSTPAV
ncbi:uncharacterized protein EV422DRAFT_570035 [Fimicolochytrium jonesii]|uniref:uncharacterized protein n=1 Tax=Fimicolochytrium jonesii TaxID=1396493 RepID=UPI0022FF21E6|nr:uncharacterized protein EV422DRAFT_570035 [Fimicolochytrium jonesii]KAI8818261.1 hypothetical protein EV422DRAFT_570035 [Fimicolochytrium jonesii]